MKTILITGATAGIGKACAIRFAKEGNCRLILTGRREQRLLDLQKELDVEVLPLAFDVRDVEAVKKAINGLKGDWQKVDVLINNAGLAVGRGPFQEGKLDDWERMLDTNVKALLYVSRMIAPLMIENGSGHIINIGSVAGREVYPGGAVYCASKHAVDALSKGMRHDLLEHGIKVTQVAPGMVETEFSLVRFKGNETEAKEVYNNIKALSGDDVARVVCFATSLPAHVNIDDVLVFATAQSSATRTHRKK